MPERQNIHTHCRPVSESLHGAKNRYFVLIFRKVTQNKAVIRTECASSTRAVLKSDISCALPSCNCHIHLYYLIPQPQPHNFPSPLKNHDELTSVYFRQKRVCDSVLQSVHVGSSIRPLIYSRGSRGIFPVVKEAAA